MDLLTPCAPAAPHLPLSDRLRAPGLIDKLMSADEAASLIRDGMVVAFSGFTRAGEAKAVPFALIRRARREAFRISLMTGASLGNEIDGELSALDVTQRRMPFQADPALRTRINSGAVAYCDQHLSHMAELLRSGQLRHPDVAVLEAVAILPDGSFIPTTSVGNSASFAEHAKGVIIELNTKLPAALEGLHDIYLPAPRPHRMPVPLIGVHGRIGRSAIPLDPSKILGIVLSDHGDSHAAPSVPDPDTTAIAGHLVEFFRAEVRRGLLPPSLLPLQAGIGSVANAVLAGFGASEFRDLTMYSEVLQDSTFDLIDAGKLRFASASSLALSEGCQERVLGNLDRYRRHFLLRPQEISNHPEVIRRLGIIAINTAIEFDIYGNVNSTHFGGSRMMNGIGGSGDFARNGHLSVFVTPSRAKKGTVPCVMPMVTHVDHTEHDVDVLVTEQGLADLRGLSPRERAVEIIRNCAHPDHRDTLSNYFHRACRAGGHTPHLLREALSWAV